MLSIRGAMAVHAGDPGDGPYMVGVSNTDLALAEIESYLETVGPLHPDDTTGVEIASRGAKIRTLGIIDLTGDGSSGVHFMDNKSMSGLRWSEEAGGWTFWIYNLGNTLVSGSIFNVQFQCFVEWSSSG